MDIPAKYVSHTSLSLGLLIESDEYSFNCSAIVARDMLHLRQKMATDTT